MAIAIQHCPAPAQPQPQPTRLLIVIYLAKPVSPQTLSCLQFGLTCWGLCEQGVVTPICAVLRAATKVTAHDCTNNYVLPMTTLLNCIKLWQKSAITVCTTAGPVAVRPRTLLIVTFVDLWGQREIKLLG